MPHMYMYTSTLSFGFAKQKAAELKHLQIELRQQPQHELKASTDVLCGTVKSR